MSLRIPLGIHDYATGKKIQKNFNMVAKDDSHIELRGRGLRNIWMKGKSGNFYKIGNGQTLPLLYAKKVAVYLIYNEINMDHPTALKDVIKDRIKAVKQKKVLKKHYKELD